MCVRKCKFVLFFSLLVLLFTSCSDGDSDNPEDQPFQTVPGYGAITDYPQFDNQDLTIYAGSNSGTVTGTDFDVELNMNTVQSVTVFDENENPVLMTIRGVGGTGEEFTIDAETTAEAIVYLMPFICSSDSDELDEIIQMINTTDGFYALKNYIESQLMAGTFNLSIETDEVLQQKIALVFDNLIDEAMRIYRENRDYYPDEQINGLEIIDYNEDSNSASFKISNRLKRWISVYVDRSEDGENFEFSNMMLDLIASPSISLWNIIFHGNLINPVESELIDINFNDSEIIAVKCYGLGLGLFDEGNQEQLDRFLLSGTLSMLLDVIFPTIEVISGVNNLTQELRGHPNSHAFGIILNDCVDRLNPINIGVYLEENDILGLLQYFGSKIFTSILENPTYVRDVIIELFPTSAITSTVLNHIFAPLRVIRMTISISNGIFTLVSILGSEAITTFNIEPADIPEGSIQIIGNVKKASTNQNLFAASIWIYDSSLNLLEYTTTDNSGNFEQNLYPGDYSLRCVYEDYTPAVVYFEVENSPSIQYIPTIYMVDSSYLTGGLYGYVNDALTGDHVPGTELCLRCGLFNPNGVIVANCTSTSIGSFEMTGILPGTYTLYMEKSGYLDNAVIVTVIGDQNTEVEVTISPEINVDGIQFVLTWGGNESDLDSHLFTPSIQGSIYHVYYGNHGSLTSPPYAMLDVDDVSYFGPETITIEQLFNGYYDYYIYNYSEHYHISYSGAHVTGYSSDGLVLSLDVPQGSGGIAWHVCRVNGTTGEVIVVNELVDEIWRGDEKIEK